MPRLFLRRICAAGQEVLHELKGVLSRCICGTGDPERSFAPETPRGVLSACSTRAPDVNGCSPLLSRHAAPAPSTYRRPSITGAGNLFLWGKWKYCDIEETYFSNVRRITPSRHRGQARALKCTLFEECSSAGAMSWTHKAEIEQFHELMKQAIGRYLRLGGARSSSKRRPRFGFLGHLCHRTTLAAEAVSPAPAVPCRWSIPIRKTERRAYPKKHSRQAGYCTDAGFPRASGGSRSPLFTASLEGQIGHIHLIRWLWACRRSTSRFASAAGCDPRPFGPGGRRVVGY